MLSAVTCQIWEIAFESFALTAFTKIEREAAKRSGNFDN
jgi:hypothetical protein